jgi:hypothetical protein
LIVIDFVFQCFCNFDLMFGKSSLFFILFILFSIYSNAQYFILGQDPASVKWEVIKSEHFRVIFPSEIEKQAQHVANMLELAFAPLSENLKSKPVHISLVLHNQSVTSNAMVPWAPKRMEWFTNPSQDDYPQPWFDQLVIHEFTHVVQYSKIYSGLTKILNYLFGQQITVGVFGTFVPLWFVEGDAVCAETAFSNAGRGRMPSFEMELRSQVLQKGIYSYDKAVFGSYRTFTPDKYVLGYHIVAEAQKCFSYDVWETAMRRTSHIPIMVVPFSSGVHKVSRMGKARLYKFCLQKLDSAWTIQDEGIKKSHFKLLSSKRGKLHSSYNHGSFIDDTYFLTVKSGINDITRFTTIDNSGKEHRLFTPGDYNTTSLSYAQHKIVWAETASDIRWENRSYSVIKSYDIITRKVKQLTHHTRYFAPSLNHLGNKIVCMEQTTDMRSFLVILDARTGAVLNRRAADSNDYVMTPTWSDNDEDVVFIALNQSGKRICLWNSKDEIIDLTKPSFTNIQQPVKSGSFVYFVGAFSGINNIYRLDSSGQIVQLTSSRFGATDPSLDAKGKEIIYSDYTADGYQLVKASVDSLKGVPLLQVTDNSIKLYKSLIYDKKPLDFYHFKENEYQVKRYNKLLHLLNFHSWGPLSIDADNTSVKPGVQVSSQNLLSTMIVSAGYEHEFNKPVQRFYTKITYKGLFPQFDFRLTYQMNKQDSISWGEFTAQCNVTVPLNLSSSKYYRSVQPQLGYLFYDVVPQNNYSSENYSGYFHVMQYSLFMYNILKTSDRDIQTRWGQTINISYKHTPFTGTNLGNILGIETMFYFPGIGKHHSLNFYLAYQQINSNGYIFNDIIASPQGIDLRGYHQMIVGKFNYEFPLFYPDWSIFSALYIKRFRSALHYDHGFVSDNENRTASYNSAGVSLLADFNLLSFVAPVTLGCRFTYSFSTHRILPELIYTINFNQLYFKPKFARVKDWE